MGKLNVLDLDRDALLHGIQRVRASMELTNDSIDVYFAGDDSFMKSQALLFHIEKIINMNLDRLGDIIRTLKESGAKDYPESWVEKAV